MSPPSTSLPAIEPGLAATAARPTLELVGAPPLRPASPCSTRNPAARPTSTSAWATGASPCTTTKGAGSTGSKNISKVPPDTHGLLRVTTPTSTLRSRPPPRAEPTPPETGASAVAGREAVGPRAAAFDDDAMELQDAAAASDGDAVTAPGGDAVTASGGDAAAAPSASALGAGTIRSRTGAPPSNVRNACRRTLDSAHAPPTNPSMVPSASTTAQSPGRADVGRSTRTTVAET